MSVLVRSPSRLCRARLFHPRQTGIIKCTNRHLAIKKLCPHGGREKLVQSVVFASISLTSMAAAICILSPSSAAFASCEDATTPTATGAAVPMDQTNITTPNWIKESRSTKANCSTHNAFQSVTNKNEGETNGSARFDAVTSEYYEIRLEATTSDNNGCKSTSSETDSESLSLPKSEQLLHNTIIVMPNLLSSEECTMIVKDTERILEDKNRKGIQGVTTESWTIYSKFGLSCQTIIKRVLEKVVLDFIESRLPEVDRALFHRHKYLDSDASEKDGEHANSQGSNNSPVSKRMAMDYYWDDPVVIKYKAGNKLAPHEDDRDLTIVVPLNPLDSFPLDGGGTRFWLEGTTPEVADETSGISVKPHCGSGILFNGNITHSGNSIFGGTRFVLMTSIALDGPIEDYSDKDMMNKYEG